MEGEEEANSVPGSEAVVDVDVTAAEGQWVAEPIEQRSLDWHRSAVAAEVILAKVAQSAGAGQSAQRAVAGGPPLAGVGEAGEGQIDPPMRLSVAAVLGLEAVMS